MLQKSVNPNAKILIVGESPTRGEAVAGKPYIGQSGKELYKMLNEAGILMQDCHLTMVSSQYASGKDTAERYFIKLTQKYQVPKAEVEAGRARLLEEIAEVKPELIIACGDLALWALTGEIGITKWRGSILEMEYDNGVDGSSFVKVIPTYAPDIVMRKWDWRFIMVQDLRRCSKESAFPEVRMPAYEFIIRPGFSQVMEVLDRLSILADSPARVDDLPRPVRDCMGIQNAAHIGPTAARNNPPRLILSGDIETRKGHIACFGIGWSDTEALCIPFITVGDEHGYWNQAEEAAIVNKLRELFRNPNIGWVFQNGLYDFQYFAVRWGFIPHIYMDTMLAQHACFAGLPKGLDFQSSMYCKFHRYWKDEGKEFHESIKTINDEDTYWTYNCKDCVATYEIIKAHENNIKSLNAREPYEFQMKQFLPVLRMMLRGVRCNRKAKDKLSLELMNAIGERELLLEQVVGHPLNIRSPKQMLDFLYQELGLPKQINRKTKRPTAEDKALETLKLKEPAVIPVLNIIQELRSLGVFLSTFVKAPLGEDLRLRSSYNIAGTETFRWSSSKDAFGTGLNLQNIPKGNE